MTTDRELLELAAKAAGYSEYEYVNTQYGLHCLNPISGTYCRFNPLTDDGDALRLAVGLGFGISIPLACKRTDIVCFSHSQLNTIVAHEGDPYAATRRAIVRAAAEIGKGMK